jgi:hypothetical protein
VTLRDTIKECVERLDRYAHQGQRIGEQNTKASLIEPVIAALGWNVLDPDEVHREYRRRSTDNPVDYALLIMRTPRLFIEAKGLGENLDDPRWANQTISYAAVAGVEWVVLTDGAEWRVYNAHAPVPIEQKLFRSVRLAKDLDYAAEVLALLGHDDLRDNRIQELWESYFVDRQVRSALAALFTGQEPPRELVNLVAKHASNLSRADVKASLMRTRASFDFPITAPLLATQPSITAPPSGTPTGPNRSAISASRSGMTGRTTVSAAERSITLRDLIDAGVLASRQPLIAEWRHQRRQADLLPDGALRVNGQTYASPSAAGEAVKIDIAGPNLKDTTRATDGWDFWKALDPATGQPVRLKELRRRHAQRAN